MGWLESLHEYLQQSTRFWVGDEAGRYAYLTDKERQALKRRKQQLKDRGAKIVKTMVDGRVLRQHRFEDERTAEYRLSLKHLIKQETDFYVEEAIETRRCQFRDNKLISDEPLFLEGRDSFTPDLEREPLRSDRRHFRYRRLEAVRYADRWWDAHNPQYPSFDVDCTNYISQCLHAGGGPMVGHPNRARGWWCSGKSWSYSWSVAHALRWYLSGATSGLRAKEVDSADQLVPGDVIGYDFEGDGHWDHSTIVTAKDLKGMPLVNAHTQNCRRVYWDYEHSVAWTSNIKYKFFRIVDDE